MANILLVDDDAEIRELIAQAMRLDGATVVSAGSTHEALELLARRDDIDVLITDIMMPEIDGFTLSHRAVALRPKLGVIYVTGYSGDLWRTIGPVSDAEVLQKPFRLSGLRSALRRVLER
jgi:two-component system cell cycle sensor histidine kinase/response regulator CckA